MGGIKMSEPLKSLKIPPDGPAEEIKEEIKIDDRISIDDFAKVQLRVGQIVEAEKVKGSRKLLKLKVDLGSETRQVVAGIAEAYEPEALIDKKIVLVANLKPATLMGIESNGMVVAATADGKPVLATFAGDVPNGVLLR